MDKLGYQWNAREIESFKPCNRQTTLDVVNSFKQNVYGEVFGRSGYVKF